MKDIQKVKNIEDSIVFAKKSEIDHFLVRDLLFQYKKYLKAYISSLIFLKAYQDLYHDKPIAPSPLNNLNLK